MIIPNQLLEYPPSALTSNYTHLSGYTYGNGIYNVTSSW
jgi:hypothetical protein